MQKTLKGIWKCTCEQKIPTWRFYTENWKSWAKKKTAGKSSQTEFLTNFTYRYFLQPNYSKHSRIFQINPEFKKIFQESPIRACCRNKNLKQIIGSSSTERKKKLKSGKKHLRWILSLLSNLKTFCCNLVFGTIFSKSTHTKCAFNIFRNIS